MTDNTPQNKAENPVNTPAALAKITDTAHDSGSQTQADALKARFKAGCIPLQTDFADVIDLANIGRQAVGGAEGQTGPANGFALSSTGRLELKPNAAKGISVDQDGVAIKLKTISGLTMDKDGVSVKPKADSGIELKESAGISIKAGNGISVDKDGIAVKAEVNKGLQVNNNGVSVTAGVGVAVSSSGVSVKAGNGVAVSSSGVSVTAGVGVAVSSSGVSVKAGNGVAVSSSGVSVTAGVGVAVSSSGVSVKAGNGVAVSSSGVSVTAGVGVAVSSSGVSIKLATNSGLSADVNNGLKIVPEQMFQRGMVMMFAGTAAEMPKGWALCDGKDGRPDLQDRFVLGSTQFTNVNKTNNQKVEGNDYAKYFNINTDSKAPDISVAVEGHTLTIEQIPAHKHSIKSSGNEGGDGQAIYERNGRAPSYKNTFSGESGGGRPHTHYATARQDHHNHNVNVVPPYYILAFIIKM